MSRTISVYNFKGGVGKTISTANLALTWSRLFKVLVIDCDPQTNLTSTLSNKIHSYTLFDAAKSALHHRDEPIICEAVNPYLDLLPGDYQMLEMESNNQFITFGPSIITKILSKVEHKYDLILLDLPSYFGKVVQSFIMNSQGVVIPAIADNFSLSGIKMLMDFLATTEKSYPLSVLGIFFNQFRSNTLHHQKVFREAKQQYGELIIDQCVRESIRISESQEIGNTIFHADHQSDVTSDFANLSEILLDRIDAFVLDHQSKRSSLLASA